MNSKNFDVVFVGSGIISLLEAVYQSKQGKKVLVIEKTNDIGGAWKPLDLFGFKNVENAIHYFLPNTTASEFMQNNLNWKLKVQTKKYRLIKVFFLNFKFYYDGRISSFLGKLESLQIDSSIKLKLKTLFSSLSHFLFKKKNKSYYLENGSPFMYDTIKKYVKKNNINILFNRKIDLIKCLKDKKKVKVFLNDKIITSSKVVITHGSQIKNVVYDKSIIQLPKHIHKRPALHMIVNDKKKIMIEEGIMFKDPIVKYFHDISRFLTPKNKLEDNKIFVFGMHHEAKNCKETIEYAFKLLSDKKIISKKAKLSDHKWSDIILPTLYDKDLNDIKKKSNSLIDHLKTENFTQAISFYSNKWKKFINLKRG